MRHAHSDVLVVGAGIAGLAAARERPPRGERGAGVRRVAIGCTIAPGPTLDRIRALEAEVARAAGV